MKKILMITTGGTIASRQTSNGLIPSRTPGDLLSFIPEVQNLCKIDTLELVSIDSTNICQKHWLMLEKTIEENYQKYDGFVICHGTDTMSYTACALSYLIQNSSKPIVLTGSQKPINLDVSDAKINLLDSFLYATSKNAHGVVIIFNGNVILGTRARKTRTKSFNAFSSIDYPKLAIVQDGRVIPYISLPKKETVFYHSMNEKIALLKLIPGMSSDILEYMLQNNDAVVIESFGVGGLPSYENTQYNEIVEKYTAMGKIIVMTTQVPNEGSDIAIYQVGHYLKKNPSILEAYDMDTEAVVTKLMWITSITKDLTEIRKYFYQTISNDILFNKEE